MTQNPPFEGAISSKQKIKSLRNRKARHYEWFTDPYDPIRGEAAMWTAVITQAMMDALSRGRNAEANYWRHEAIHWLTSNSKDFITVCLFAGMDPDYVRRMAKRALASPVSWRAEPGKGRRYVQRKAYRKRLKQQLVPSLALAAHMSKEEAALSNS